MPRMIFVSLPVTDLQRSIAFYEAVGAVRDAQFSDAAAARMVVSETINVMLLTHERFSGFTPRTIPNAHVTAQTALILSEDTREAVDDRVAKAAAAGGTADPNPVEDHGFMYSRSYADPDGHILEAMWMDPSQALAQPAG